MIIYIIISGGALIVGLIVFFVVKVATAKDESIVPISDFNEIKELKGTFMPESQNFPESNSQESVSENDQPLENDESKAFEEQLRGENQQLKVQIDEHRKSFAKLEREVEELKLERKRLVPMKILVEELKKKADLLEQRYLDHQKSQTEMVESIEKLELQRDQLLESQKTSFDQSEFEDLRARLSGSIEAIERLKEENCVLKKANEDLKNTFKETKEFNALLVEKEQIMQYELVKNRAQSLGLEKICEDFKIQIEEMSAASITNQE